MNKDVQVKIHPEKPIYSTLPEKLPSGDWIVGYETHLQIEGKYVLKFKITMLVRGGTIDVKYDYRMDIKLGFKESDVQSEDHFYYLCNYCYQTAVIEFNKSLDNLNCKDYYMDSTFESFENIKRKVDNALNPQMN